MLKRKAYRVMEQWKSEVGRRALLVTGARQVGKTYLIREFARNNYENFIEINLISNRIAAKVIEDAASTKDLMTRLSIIADAPMVPGRTLVFLDEVQKCKEIVTAIKFLVEQGDYDFILSGSLLGVEMRDVRSIPVGYLGVLEMFPLDFEEYCWANGVSEDDFSHIQEAFRAKRPLPEYMLEHFMGKFREYLLVGGMPAPVSEYVQSHNMQIVRKIQNDIRKLNRGDISQYADSSALTIKDIYDQMPSQLNKENKSFEVRSLGEHARLRRYENRFLWLIDAGVALPCYRVGEPRYPLLLAKSSSKFKLYLNDVGLLTGTFGKRDLLDMLHSPGTVNYGSTYENLVAQELTAHGAKLYYYSKNKFGEVDFVLDAASGSITLIEVKSGTGFNRHKTLTKLLDVPGYSFDDALVLCDSNVNVCGEVSYLPIYMASCIE
ncbi:MAG: AAA family ATPase [Coriobacteriaceae bacterium]|jgi:predicted AAA+ superfamily ATPase|nr:AAA family ATPase [Coriobacteriaceae bacterium]